MSTHHLSPFIWNIQQMKENRHCCESAGGQKHDGKFGSAGTFLNHTRGFFSSFSSGAVRVHRGPSGGLILCIFSSSSHLTAVLCSQTKWKLQSAHRLLTTESPCRGFSIITWQKSHLNSVFFIVCLCFCLSRLCTSLPETLFTRCLSSWQSKYQRGGKGKWKEGLLCKSWPAVRHSERVKQIIHEMASRAPCSEADPF